MLSFLRTALLIGNAIAIPASLFLGWALVFGVQPVDFEWVTQAKAKNGEIIEGSFVPSCKPRILTSGLYSQNALTKFAAEAVVDLNTFDYLNWDRALPEAADRYMTRPAARVFMDSFVQGRLLAGVKREYLSVSTQLISSPILTASSSGSAGQKWTVQVPVDIYYGTGAQTVDGVSIKENMTQTFVFTVHLVEQAPSQKNFRGIAVVKIDTTRIPRKSVLETLRDG